MISAELEHRDYVDSYTIAIQFSHLRFHGNEDVVSTLNDIALLIEVSQAKKNNIKITCLKEKYDKNNENISLFQQEFKDLRKRLIKMLLYKDYRIKWKQLRKEISELQIMNEKIHYQIQKIDEIDNQWNGRYHNVYTLNREYKKVLSKLGFSLKSAYNNKRTDIDHEIYEFSGNEQELLKDAKILLNKITQDLEEKCSAIEINYKKKLAEGNLPDANGYYETSSNI